MKTILTLILVTVVSANAETRKPASPKYDDVANAVNGTGSTGSATGNGGCGSPPVQCTTVADHGTVVQIPAGEETWPSNKVLTVTKDIQLIGAGMDELNTTPFSPPRPHYFQVDKTKATIIHLTNPTGKLIDATFQGTDFTTRIGMMVIELEVGGGSYMFNLGGRSFRHHQGNNPANAVVGGLRFDHVRIRNTADASPWPIAANAHIWNWSGDSAGVGAGDFISGRFDHVFEDFQDGSHGSEVSSFGASGHPVPGATPNGLGQYQWEQPYTGGGGDDTELNCIFVEDNIFHRGGFNLGTLGGGGRLVVRFNTTWGGLTGHGIDGGNMGPASWEYYNNWFIDYPSGSSTNLVGTRGGAAVITNNRFQIASQNQSNAGQPYRSRSTVSRTIGPATGRNFLDENCRGDLNSTTDDLEGPVGGEVYVAETPAPSDPRLGSVYAHGSNPTVVSASTKYTLNGLSGGSNRGRWAGFILINLSSQYCPPLTNGDQTMQPVGTPNWQYWATIADSTATNPTTVTVLTGANNGNLNLGATDNWEIRRVKTYFANPGGGLIPVLSSGGKNDGINCTTNCEQTGFYYLTDNANGKRKYWAGQIPYGLWQKGNMWRADANGTFANWQDQWTNTIPPIFFHHGIQGKGHNNTLPLQKKNDGSGGGYPDVSITDPADPRLRIGAHWTAPGFPQAGFAEFATLPASSGTPAHVYFLQEYPNATGEATNPRITSTAMTAYVGQPLATTFPLTSGYPVQVADFTGPVTYSKTSGSNWPPGSVAFAINSSTGIITGTPNTAGNYTTNLTASQTTPTSVTATADLAITVVAATPTPTPTPTATPTPTPTPTPGPSPATLRIRP